MTPEIYIRHVDEAIEKALRHQAWLDESVLSITGFSTGEMRRLMSNICHMPKSGPTYLEVGLFGGATFVSAFNNNATLTAIGIEDFSQPFGNNGIRDELEGNIERYKAGCRDVQIINADCFSVPPKFNNLVDVYMYDGSHDYDAQAKALPYFFDSLAPLFIFTVDDFSWSSVREGTATGFKTLENKVKIEKEWILSDGKNDGPKWHNDFAIYVCSKL